jgi:hypothetical protein
VYLTEGADPTVFRHAASPGTAKSQAPAGSLDDLMGHSITYRITVGSRAGQKVFTLLTVSAQGEGEGHNDAAQVGGFSVMPHAGVLADRCHR